MTNETITATIYVAETNELIEDNVVRTTPVVGAVMYLETGDEATYYIVKVVEVAEMFGFQSTILVTVNFLKKITIPIPAVEFAAMQEAKIKAQMEQQAKEQMMRTDVSKPAVTESTVIPAKEGVNE